MACNFHTDPRSEYHVVLRKRSKYSSMQMRDLPAKSSEVGCVITGARWMTTAKYVDELPDMTSMMRVNPLWFSREVARRAIERQDAEAADAARR